LFIKKIIGCFSFDKVKPQHGKTYPGQ